MRKTENSERPLQRKDEVKERGRIERHRVPLGQEGQAATAQRIPEGNFTAPKTLAAVVGQRIAEQTKVSQNQSATTKYDVRKGSDDQEGENDCETSRLEPCFDCWPAPVT